MIPTERQRAADLLGISVDDVNSASDEYRHMVEQAAKSGKDGAQVAPEFDPRTLTAAREAWNGMTLDDRKAILDRAGVKRNPKMEWDGMGRTRHNDPEPAQAGDGSCGEGGGTPEGGDAGNRGESVGRTDADRNQLPDEVPALSGARGRGGGAETVHPAAARAGDGGDAAKKGQKEKAGVNNRRGGRGGKSRPSTKTASGPVDVPPQDRPNLPAANFRITDELELGKGSEAVKFGDNIRAIEILKNIEEQNWRATAEEILLRQQPTKHSADEMQRDFYSVTPVSRVDWPIAGTRSFPADLR